MAAQIRKKLDECNQALDGLPSGSPEYKCELYVSEILEGVLAVLATHICIDKQELQKMIDERKEYLKDWKISVQEPQYSKIWGEIGILEKVLGGGVEGAQETESGR